MSRLNLKAPLRWLGPKEEFGHFYASQDGQLFAWSESNYGYETAWWLTLDGRPRMLANEGQRRQAAAILKAHPFDVLWLS